MLRCASQHPLGIVRGLLCELTPICALDLLCVLNRPSEIRTTRTTRGEVATTATQHSGTTPISPVAGVIRMNTGQALTLGVTGEMASAARQQPRLLNYLPRFALPLMSGNTTQEETGPMEEMSTVTTGRSLFC
jgi:hypothetical protein